MEDFPQGLSLQYDRRWYEEARYPEIDLVQDLEGLIALISVLGQVICVSTSVAHIAGAVGTSTDVILAPLDTRHPENMINWRYVRNKRLPWYNSVKVYPGLREWNVTGLRQWNALHPSAVQEVRSNGKEGPEGTERLAQAL